ncbi:Hypothetical_protein [Hexamita inflata]|uniref:Hypothetical_protein n=1 Tax=Hexamita inflata TaxID=28002 RepID=A0ABP1HAG0_9EUKA
MDLLNFYQLDQIVLIILLVTHIPHKLDLQSQMLHLAYQGLIYIFFIQLNLYPIKLPCYCSTIANYTSGQLVYCHFDPRCVVSQAPIYGHIRNRLRLQVLLLQSKVLKSINNVNAHEGENKLRSNAKGRLILNNQ